jgi:tRNA pseudouridine38-40 synthase
MASFFYYLVLEISMGEEKNIRLILQYEGSNYHGWQRQKNGVSVQGIIEERLALIFNKQITLYGSGRTDAGVHALYQVANFYSDTSIPPESIKKALNSLLPDDIYVKKAEYTMPEFHSRYSAKRKTYEYRILNANETEVFLRRYTWHLKETLDLIEMRKCLAMIIGVHDFSSFRSSGSSNINPVREMFRAELSERDQDGVIRFTFEASGFLRHMVRNLVGTIVDAGKGKITYAEFKEILEAHDRKRAGAKAPAQGLFLKMVEY